MFHLLFEYLCSGEEIGQAASHAVNYIILPFDNVRDYQIAGSIYTKIISADDIGAINNNNELLELFNEIQLNMEKERYNLYSFFYFVYCYSVCKNWFYSPEYI